ncbi:hypothetical protein L596_008392 [Steinernema carpocapsae]|uniref:Uncharacterized protein n=1 Tax=Steinernema carpocapsae TaxID=34508 RepID=A0A4U5PCC1_STECR|nr:hypothetical protein L596_008392 [Steinernema carpocapsae]
MFHHIITLAIGSTNDVAGCVPLASGVSENKQTNLTTQIRRFSLVLPIGIHFLRLKRIQGIKTEQDPRASRSIRLRLSS